MIFFHALTEKIREVEAALSVNGELKSASVDYAKSRALFDGYCHVAQNDNFALSVQASKLRFFAEKKSYVIVDVLAETARGHF